MTKLHNLKVFKERRKDLRNNATDAEKRLWYFLKDKQLEGRKFTRQHSISKYVVDFYCPTEQLIIELEGEHHKEAEQLKYDEVRTKYLESLHKSVLRFNNMEVLFNPDKVLKEIVKHFNKK